MAASHNSEVFYSLTRGIPISLRHILQIRIRLVSDFCPWCVLKVKDPLTCEYMTTLHKTIHMNKNCRISTLEMLYLFY